MFDTIRFDRKRTGNMWVLAFITVWCLLSLIQPAAAAGNITVIVDGMQKNYDPAPQMINNRVLVPMRAIFEELGAEVRWDGSTRSAMAFKDGKYVSVKIGSRIGTTAAASKVNGEYQLSNIQKVQLDVAPVIYRNSTMLPLRFVSESLGSRVDWSGASRQVLISTPEISDLTSNTSTPAPPVTPTTPSIPTSPITSPVASAEMRGAWLSFNDMTNFDTVRIDAFLDAAAGMKLNTVFVHARAFSDAFYKSALFPWSHRLTGVQGRAPAIDPLQYVIDGCRKRGLRVEAWINPYRISTSTELTNTLAPNNPAVKWLNDPTKVLKYQINGEQCLIYNPDSPEVRNLITAGILEILNKYDVDGIHFDDYFYVTGIKEAYANSYKEDEVNKLVRQVYAAVKGVDPDLTFGISPAGNITNCNAAGADVQTWLSQEGYVDYVCPQIYWTNQYVNSRFQFNNCLNDWVALKKSSKVKLYTGLALYRVGTESSSDPGWKSRSDNMLTQVQQMRSTGKCSGFALFDISDLVSPAAQTELGNLKTKL
ncbi:MAG: family 10 glycosylhydrolase [Deltaproteobacteria bacterium]